MYAVQFLISFMKELLFVRVLKKKTLCMFVCAPAMFEREKLYYTANPTAVYASGAMLESNGKSLVLHPNKILLKAIFFEISTSNLEDYLFRFMALIF